MAVRYVAPKEARLRDLWHRHFADPRRERAFLSVAGFNLAFLTCRVVTHSIRAGIGPFHNMSADGRQLHNCTFGIFGLMGIGYSGPTSGRSARPVLTASHRARPTTALELAAQLSRQHRAGARTGA
jgi:hypothetical protein